MCQKEALDSAVESNNSSLIVGFQRRDDLVRGSDYGHAVLGLNKTLERAELLLQQFPAGTTREVSEARTRVLRHFGSQFIGLKLDDPLVFVRILQISP